MTSVESLISMHRDDMEMLRGEARAARKDRLSSRREMDQAFKELRSKLTAELPVSTHSFGFRGAVTFMVTLLGVLSY